MAPMQVIGFKDKRVDQLFDATERAMADLKKALAELKEAYDDEPADAQRGADGDANGTDSG